MNMFRLVAIVLPATFLLAACGGRDANPVAAKQIGDKELSCEELEIALIDIQGDVNDLIGEKSDSRSENVAWGVAGLFIPVLWLGLDLTETEQVEMRALEKRARELERLARKNKCDI